MFSLFDFKFVMTSRSMLSYYFTYNLGTVKGTYGLRYERN